MMRLESGKRFKHKNRYFTFEVAVDEASNEPWKEVDGHGVVSEWVSREKNPGEQVLVHDRDHNFFRFYDVEATTKIAVRDGWGLGAKEAAMFAERLGRAPLPQEIIAEAVRQDFVYLKSWCDDEWHYVTVTVRLLQRSSLAEGGFFETKYFDTLGGVQSDSPFMEDTARQLADECLAAFRKERAK